MLRLKVATPVGAQGEILSGASELPTTHLAGIYGKTTVEGAKEIFISGRR